MKQKVLYAVLVAITVAILAILLIGLSADDPIAQARGGRGGGRGGGGHRGGGGGARQAAPRQGSQRPQGHSQQAPRQQQQSHRSPSNTQRHLPPTQQIRGGGSRENPHTSRSPSMSRSVQSQPARSHMPQQQRPRPQGQQQIPRPHGGQQQSQLPRPHGGQQRGQVQQHNIQARQQAKKFIQQKNATIPNASSSFQPPTPVTSGILQQQQALSTRADRTRNVINQRNPRADGWFSDRFFEDHNCHPFFHNQGDNWWWAPSWVGVSSWLPWGWDSAYYYTDQGSAYTVPPESYALPPDLYVQPPQQEWMPLGVFAAGQSASEVAYSTMFVQLAVNKDGQIAGTYYNTATNEVHDLDGQVDQYTQEAAWTVSDKPNSPTMTTGLYNLTQDAAIVQVHFQDGSMQTWTLVRLNK